MKKVSALVLALIIALSAFGCKKIEKTNPAQTSDSTSSTPDITEPDATPPEITSQLQSSSDNNNAAESDTKGVIDFSELFGKEESYNGFSFVRLAGENASPLTYRSDVGDYVCDNNNSRFYVGGDGLPAISSWNGNTVAICFTATFDGVFSFDLSVHRWNDAAEGTASFYFMRYLKGVQKISQVFITEGNVETNLKLMKETLLVGESIYIVYECGKTGANNDAATIRNLKVTVDDFITRPA